MADRLTQLQDCLDDLATQMFASLRYIQTQHAYATIEGQPDQNPHPQGNASSANRTSDAAVVTNGAAAAADAQESALNQSIAAINGATEEPVPDSPEVFQAAMRELARDLVLKEQQIEYLIGVLPGIGTSERDQNERIRALETELNAAEEERQVAMRERKDMVHVLGQLAATCKRVY